MVTDRETITRWYDFLTDIRVTAVPFRLILGGGNSVDVSQNGHEINMGFIASGKINGYGGELFEF